MPPELEATETQASPIPFKIQNGDQDQTLSIPRDAFYFNDFMLGTARQSAEMYVRNGSVKKIKIDPWTLDPDYPERADVFLGIVNREIEHGVEEVVFISPTTDTYND